MKTYILRSPTNEDVYSTLSKLQKANQKVKLVITGKICHSFTDMKINVPDNIMLSFCGAFCQQLLCINTKNTLNFSDCIFTRLELKACTVYFGYSLVYSLSVHCTQLNLSHSNINYNPSLTTNRLNLNYSTLYSSYVINYSYLNLANSFLKFKRTTQNNISQNDWFFFDSNTNTGLLNNIKFYYKNNKVVLNKKLPKHLIPEMERQINNIFN